MCQYAYGIIMNEVFSREDPYQGEVTIGLEANSIQLSNLMIEISTDQLLLLSHTKDMLCGPVRPDSNLYGSQYYPGFEGSPRRACARP